MKNSEKGFGLVEAIFLVVFIGLIVVVGWLYLTKQGQAHKGNVLQDRTSSSSQQNPADKEKRNSYTIDNEGLIFDYNPGQSEVKGYPATQSDLNGTYTVNTVVVTGDVVLKITTGIDGIGGVPACNIGDRETCRVIDLKDSTYLGEPITYRLIEAKLVTGCGSPGAPSCDTVPLATAYIIDTSTSNEAFGPCCGTISSEAKNLEKKAKNAGRVLIDIETSEEISNSSLFSNSDLLETIKIVETLRYKNS